MGVCYIVGAGDFFGEIRPEPSDMIIAADGGYDALLSRGVTPDLVIGDMDSVECEISGVRMICHPVKKDETDMHLAYLYGKQSGYREFYIYGGTGGRPDHTFANYSLLFLAKNAGDSITIVDEKYDIFAMQNEEKRFFDKVGHTLSVFAFSEKALGVCISGTEYEAKQITLSNDFALGISNEITDGCATVSVECGRLLVMLSR